LRKSLVTNRRPFGRGTAALGCFPSGFVRHFTAANFEHATDLAHRGHVALSNLNIPDLHNSSMFQEFFSSLGRRMRSGLFAFKLVEVLKRLADPLVGRLTGLVEVP
jgi:hypothetical protein